MSEIHQRIEELKKCVKQQKAHVLKVIKNYEMKAEAISTFLGHTRNLVVEELDSGKFAHLWSATVPPVG